MAGRLDSHGIHQMSKPKVFFGPFGFMSPPALALHAWFFP